MHRTPIPARVALRAIVFGMLLVPTGCDRSPEETGAPATSGPADAPQPVVRTAESGPLRVTMAVDRDRVESPNPIRLTLRVVVESGVEVTVPKLEGIVGPFNIADVKERAPDCGVYVECREWTYTLEGVLPGAAKIPPLTVSFRDAREKTDGSNEVFEDTVTLEAIPVTITQALADVKDPVSLPMPFRYKLLGWALGVVVAMAAIALAARWWRRRRARPEALPTAARVPPHVWAMAELDKLMAEDLIARGRIQEFYYRINGLLRRYIELRFGLMAGEQTSEEFIRSLGESDSLRAAHKGMLRAFVAACDPVKYARQQPGPDEIAWVQTSARTFVVETAEAAPGGGDGSGAAGTGREVAA